VNPWKIILATLVIFGTGVITGGLLVHYTNQSQPRPQAARPQAPLGLTPWQMRNRDLIRRIQRDLNLTAEQRTNIERIIIDSQERTRSLWRPIVPQMNREMQHVNELIRAELSEDQQKKFDELIKPRQMRKTDDSMGPDHRHRLTNSLSPEAPAAYPAPGGPQ
jgi:Spy/CpxP family protein refolding chaperone